MNLAKEKYFKEGASTNLAEIKKLANLLLNTRFDIDIYSFKEPFVFIPALAGWKFEFNTRKGAAGLCAYKKKTIYISKWLLEQNLEKAEEFENTLRHELAHAIDFEMREKSDHGRVWKAVAREVLCSAERCFKGIDTSKATSKYTLTCPVCDKKNAGHKKRKKKTACGDCCRTYNFGRYSEKYVLIVTQNY